MTRPSSLSLLRAVFRVRKSSRISLTPPIRNQTVVPTPITTPMIMNQIQKPVQRAAVISPAFSSSSNATPITNHSRFQPIVIR